MGIWDRPWGLSKQHDIFVTDNFGKNASNADHVFWLFENNEGNLYGHASKTHSNSLYKRWDDKFFTPYGTAMHFNFSMSPNPTWPG